MENIDTLEKEFAQFKEAVDNLRNGLVSVSCDKTADFLLGEVFKSIINDKINN